MNTCFYLYSVVHNRPETASSRIRGDWLINHWSEAERIHIGRKYDACVFQKVYEVPFAKVFPGVKILDVCDPDWLKIKEPFVEMIEEVDAITCPTERLQKAIQGWTKKPVVVIPDRHDLNFFKEKKIHRGKAKEVCWYGYSHNASSLKSVRQFLIKNNLAISIIADEPIILSERENNINIHERFTKWNIETVNKEIIKSDIVILPGSRDPNTRFKSNNKTVNAWLLNMPVATSAEDLERFMDPEERIKESDKNYEIARREYDIKLSVKEMQELIERLKK